MCTHYLLIDGSGGNICMQCRTWVFGGGFALQILTAKLPHPLAYPIGCTDRIPLEFLVQLQELHEK